MSGAASIARRRLATQGMTLLELLTVVIVIGILFTMLLPAFASMKSRADRGTCTNNLRGLYTAANGYIQEQGHWPQIRTKSVRDPDYALKWVAALKPYGVGHKNWICPTVQTLLHSPDYTEGKQARIDYFATPFDAKPQTPFRWPNQPWFIERSNAHGDGQMVIFTNSQLRSLKDIAKSPGLQRYEN